MKKFGYLPAVCMVLLLITLPALSASCKSMSASAEINLLQATLHIFQEDQGRYLNEDEGLIALTEERWGQVGEEKYSYIRRLPNDPWGHPYQYKKPGIHNQNGFDIWTFGADGKPGGEGINRDCGNWEQGRCYEARPAHKDYLKIGLLIVLSPIFWLPVYVVCSIYLKIKGNSVKSALVGRHLKILLWTVPLFFLLLVWPAAFEPLC